MPTSEHSDDRQVLLHVGLNKTASGWLQKHVFASRAMGFASPFPRGGGKERNLVDALVRPHPLEFDPEATRASLQPRVEETLREGVVPVLSTGRLAGHADSGGYDTKEIAERLREVFGDGRILMIIREQRSSLLANYRQHVRGGGGRSIEAYLDPHAHYFRGYRSVAPSFRLEYFGYDRQIEMYQALFGAANVLVLPYELFLRDAHDYVRRICAFARATPDAGTIAALPAGRLEHESDSAAVLAARRQLNKLFVSDPANPAPLIPSRRAAEWVRRNVHRVGPVVPGPVTSRIERHLDETAIRLADGRYRESNRRTSELIGIDLAELGLRDLTPSAPERQKPR